MMWFLCIFVGGFFGKTIKQPTLLGNSDTTYRRTLRSLFALARGISILTEDWVYESVSKEEWANVRDFVNPKFNQNTKNLNNHNREVFRNKSICVLESTNPPSDVLIHLIQAAGGQVTSEIDPDDDTVDLFVFGKQVSHALLVCTSMCCLLLCIFVLPNVYSFYQQFLKVIVRMLTIGLMVS